MKGTPTKSSEGSVNDNSKISLPMALAKASKDTNDDRFSALLEGTDDRFGIDRTNPAFKETTAMKTLLEEQAKRRKKNRGKSKVKSSDKSKPEQSDAKGGNKDHSWVESSSGAMELSSLVKSLQTKVKSTDKPKKKKLRQ